MYHSLILGTIAKILVGGICELNSHLLVSQKSGHKIMCAIFDYTISHNAGGPARYYNLVQSA